MGQNLILLTGFSGAGKTTLFQELVSRHPDQLIKVISNTTRAPRPGEVHGKDYNFLSHDEFHAKREAGHFLEHSEHYGNWYASTAPEQLDLVPGQIPLYVIDPGGFLAIREKYPHAHQFFLYVSPEEQYKRLSARDFEPHLLESRLAAYEREHQVLEAHKDKFNVLRHESVEDLQNAVEYIRKTLQLG